MGAMVSLVKAQGAGRLIAFVCEKSGQMALAQSVMAAIPTSSKAVLIECDEVTETNWREIACALVGVFESHDIRHAMVIGFGAAAAVVQCLMLETEKLIRHALLVEAVTRPHPSEFSTWIDSVERYLPLGLPLRSLGEGFDGRPYLHAMRCPVVVLTFPNSNSYLCAQAEAMEKSLPSCRWVRMEKADASNLVGELVALIQQFSTVPARAPQRVRKS